MNDDEKQRLRQAIIDGDANVLGLYYCFIYEDGLKGTIDRLSGDDVYSCTIDDVATIARCRELRDAWLAIDDATED